MILNRRSFVAMGAAGLAINAGGRTDASSVNRGALAPVLDSSRIGALVFDAFAVFDPRPVFLVCEQLFPGRGAALANAWRGRQFEYQWLRALAGHYTDFWQTTQSALDFAARSLQLDLAASHRQTLMQGFMALKAWPDVPDALAQLKRSGRKLALLSNATEQILNAGIGNAGLKGVFDHMISTDRIRTFKPDPRAYQLGVDATGVRKANIMFVAFAGWDAAGARWFGYPTFWNNRLNATAEELGAAPDGTGATLNDLIAMLDGRAARG